MLEDKLHHEYRNCHDGGNPLGRKEEPIAVLQKALSRCVWWNFMAVGNLEGSQGIKQLAAATLHSLYPAIQLKTHGRGVNTVHVE